MEIIDNGLKVPKWVLIVWPKIHPKPPKLCWSVLLAPKIRISLKNASLGVHSQWVELNSAVAVHHWIPLSAQLAQKLWMLLKKRLHPVSIVRGGELSHWIPLSGNASVIQGKRFQLKCVSLLLLKGQIKSEWIYEVIDFPNYQLKNLKDFCPKSVFEAQSKISGNNFEYTWQT